MKRLLLLLPATLLHADCIRTAADTIRVADLVQAVPVLATLESEIQFGYAPQPGVRRTLRGIDLEHFAARFGLHLENPADLCVEAATRHLDPNEVQAAVETSMTERTARVRVVDFLRGEVPVGKLEADANRAWNLPAAPAAALLLWRGWIAYGTGRRFPVWARVAATVRVTRALAARDLGAGDTVESSDIRLESTDEPLSRTRSVEEPSALAGKQLRRAVRMGQPLSAEMLQAPIVVHKGQNVAVLVVSRQAALRLSATAETAARAGEFVILKNPETGKRFRARADADGTLLVQVGAEGK